MEKNGKKHIEKNRKHGKEGALEEECRKVSMEDCAGRHDRKMGMELCCRSGIHEYAIAPVVTCATYNLRK